jgi:chorismate mutase-like protein
MSASSSRSTPDLWNAPLRRLDAPWPEPSDSPTVEDLGPWRDRIDALDEAVIHLLNERAAYAARIGQIKRSLELPVYVPTREEDVLRNVIDVSQGPLPASSVRRLYERIIDETRSLERRLHDD